MAANRIFEDYKMCHLSECKEINQALHNWFFPVITPEIPASKPKRIIEQEKPKEKHSAWEEYYDMLEKYFPERLQNYVLR